MAVLRTFAAPMACLASLALLGCNGADGPASSTASVHTSAATALSGAAPLNAPGTGITTTYAPGCTPVIGTDFMDRREWNARRVEPQDCALVHAATPVFAWPFPDDLSGVNNKMMFTLRRPSDGFTVSVETTVPRVLLSDLTLPSGDPATLPPGEYEWTVQYHKKWDGQTFTPSATRRFTVAGDPATLMALPGSIAFARTVAAKSHPRALPAGIDFAQIVAAAKGSLSAKGEYATAYEAFIAAANAQAAPDLKAPPEPASATEYVNVANLERSAIETLGYAWHFTGDIKYRDAAIKRLLALAAWSPTGGSSEANEDQANRQVYLGLGLGLDLLQNALTSAERGQVVAPLRARLTQTMNLFGRLYNSPNDSHMLSATAFTTEALMYAAGTPEFTDAEEMLAKSWKTYVTNMGAWGSTADGGYGNGDAYSWYTMTTTARVVAAIKLIANVDLTPLRAIGQLGNSHIATTAPNILLRGQFGDQVEIDKQYSDYAHDAYRLYASVTGKAEHEWYWRVNSANVQRRGPLQAMHYLLLGLRVPQAPSTTPALPNSWVFEDAGIVAMHTASAETNRSSVFFRSSRFGSYNHSHADNNAFTFVSHGKAMLISGGYRPEWLSEHHALVGRATRFKNALTFDGGIGQAEPASAPTAPGKPIHSMDMRGKLINFADNGIWAITTGDATLAYRGMAPATTTLIPLLSNAIRSVGFNREKRVVVIYDWATSDTARKWELNFQTLQESALAGTTLRVTNGGVYACVDVYGMAGAFALTSGFPVAPENKAPDQYQARYSAAAASKELVSVTVIREDCNDVAVKVGFSGTSASVAIGGAAPLIFDRKTIKSQ